LLKAKYTASGENFSHKLTQEIAIVRCAGVNNQNINIRVVNDHCKAPW